MRGADRVLCQPSTPLIVAPLCFLDIETSGLRADRGARITEIALLTNDGIRMEWQMSDRCQVGSDDHDAAVKAQLKHLVTHLRNVVTVGHNVPFDLRFVAYECRRLNVRGLTVQMIDTLALARRSFPDAPDHRLETLAAEFDLSVPGEFHTALVDAEVTRSLLEKITDARSLTTLGDAGIRRLSWSSDDAC
jgi:DNA polymerase III epsilon subunit-like protein